MILRKSINQKRALNSYSCIGEKTNNSRIQTTVINIYNTLREVKVELTISFNYWVGFVYFF